MLITDDFVLLNNPKTGSTFSRKIIQQIYRDDCEELLFPVAYDWRYIGPDTQHGTYAQIPERHRGKPVLSIIRNPFDRYVSQYRFKWYELSPPASRKKLRKFYPDFPELKFPEFLDMGERFSKMNMLAAYDIFSDTDIGFQSIGFIAFFSGSPKKDLADLVRGVADPFLRLPEIHFLHQESLREELTNFLAGINPNRDIGRIIASEHDANVNRSSGERDFMQFWTPNLLKEYCEKDRFLLNVFPEYRPDIPAAAQGYSPTGIVPARKVNVRTNDAALNPAVVRVSRKLRATACYAIKFRSEILGAARRPLGMFKRYVMSFAKRLIK